MTKFDPPAVPKQVQDQPGLEHDMNPSPIFDCLLDETTGGEQTKAPID
jgi:hypothetical protein